MRTTLAILAFLALAGCENNDTDSMRDTNRDTMDSRDTTESRTSGNQWNTHDNTMAKGSVSADDRNFVNNAAIGGMFEVQSSEFALRQNPAEHTRHIAQMMIDDHTKANNELKALAQRKGISVPTSLDAKHREMMDQLRQSTGMTFGDEYREIQVKAHEEAVALFEAAKEADDSDIRAFAEKTLPTLRKHLDHVRNSGAGASHSNDM